MIQRLMRIILGITLPLAVLALGGCPGQTPSFTNSTNDSQSEETTFSMVPRDSFFPPVSGAVLIYENLLTFEMPTGNPASPSATSIATGSTTVTVTSLINNDATTSTIVVYPSATTTRTELYSAKSDGSVTSRNPEDALTDITTYGSALFSANETIIYPEIASASAQLMTYLGQDSIWVPAGSWKCHKFKIAQARNDDGYSLEGTIWFAPKLGLVKQSILGTCSIPQGVATVSEQIALRSYNLPPSPSPSPTASTASDLMRFAGTYTCVGGYAYPIVLKSDGTYTYASKTGTYRYECTDKEWLVFSGPLADWAGGRSTYANSIFSFSWWEDNQPVSFTYKKQ